jgi:hypothetical protein
MVSELDEFCDNEEHSIFERSFAAAILFCTWECMRLLIDAKGAHSGHQACGFRQPARLYFRGICDTRQGKEAT